MKAIKVIDLLNKIANGEEVPEKIRYGNKTYHREKTIEDELYYYVLDDDDFTLLIEVIHSFYDLNRIVEIIEDTPKEDKKIEDTARFQYSQIPSWFNIKEVIEVVNENFEKNQQVLNKIIDKLNGK